MAVPTDPNKKLRRGALAEALTEEGYPTSAATLATKATRGGGPPFQLYGRIPLYTWGPALSWAEGRLSPPRCSTSEADAAWADLGQASVKKPERHPASAATGYSEKTPSTGPTRRAQRRDNARSAG
jgi:hypothetical protein